MTASYRATVDGNRKFDLSPDDVRVLDLVPTGGGTHHLLEDGRPSRIQVLEARPQDKFYRIRVDNRVFEVVLADDLDLRIDRMGFDLKASRQVSRVEAPMPGLILSVEIAEGDTVKQGDTLLVLEAMKMENAILAPADGVIGRVAVAEGQAVEKKSVLVEFET